MVNYSTYCPTPKICFRPVLHFFPLDLEMLWHHASFIPLQLGFQDRHLPLAFCQGAIVCACAIYVCDSGGSRLTHVISFQLFQGLLYRLQCSGYSHHLLLEAAQIQLLEPVLAQIRQHVIWIPLQKGLFDVRPLPCETGTCIPMPVWALRPK